MRYAIKVFGLVCCLAVSACDGEDGEPGQFVGRWRAEAGTLTKVCPGEGERAEAVAGDVVWTGGRNADLVSTTPLMPCRLKADVSDGTASIVPGHVCTRSDGAGGTVMVTFDSYEFVLLPLGNSAFERASGQITRERKGVATACAFTQAAWYQRAPDDEATPSVSAR
jgi:hypothetical protein